VSGRELRIREEIAEREGITHVGGNYKVGRNPKWEEIPESGEMHEWEEITEPAKVQEWERFPSAGKLPSAAKLQFRGEFAKVRKTTKSSWSICGVLCDCRILTCSMDTPGAVFTGARIRGVFFSGR
jgi:hypothetical protein